MKNKILIAVFCLTMMGCSLGDSEVPPIVQVIEWHLINVSGGVTGINETFEPETIIWVFNDDTGVLTVENTNEDDMIEDGLSTGNYNFSIATIDDKRFLTIDSNEFGEITFNTESELNIDQNSLSTGNGADGFIYKFTRKIVTQ